MTGEPPSARALLRLYASLLRTSRSFSSYNFRTYFTRQTKQAFREIQSETNPTRVTSFYRDNLRELAVLRRSAVVNQLYGGSRVAVEEDGAKR